MKKVSNIKERIKEFAENTGLTQDVFFKKINSTAANFRGKKLETGVNADLIERIVSLYPSIDLHWLITGEKKIEEIPHEGVMEESAKYQLTKKGVPYYDVEFTSGFTFLENSQTTKPASYIAHPFFATSDFVVRNSGQSMAKVIKHGDAIGLKHLPNWQEFLAYGEIYAIVLADDRRLVKIITKGEDADSFTLISKPSDNKKDEFPPQQIKKSLIRNVFRVEAASCLF